ncbi:efflux RND transporter periplasmic adaptor subunit [Bacillus sp. V3B]|uniref:efflux RND transporter periplasmic adaptor subunit n=1 Tax=Bacillus sp. V3B TaxID=2804915 RepID=UPI002109A1FF|nr:efflux RND transporter periplasmic adaptor subunit [Bacillus sp. V3B]MCQ6277577.1 efflux RND transporter periplasmic adaptor subunit [Bacillus sp. V3B]
MHNEPQVGTGNQTATYPFQVELNEFNEELKSGYQVNVEVEIKGEMKKPVVLVESIVTDDQGEFVYVVIEDTLKKQYIETGILDNNFKEVISGLEVDEKILLNPSNGTSEEMEIIES